MAAGVVSMDWVLLTVGQRPAMLSAALSSLEAMTAAETDGRTISTIIVVSNGAGPITPIDGGARLVEAATNLGVPGGRHLGVQSSSAEILGFLDDDAELRSPARRITDAFAADQRLGAVAFKLVDEQGVTARRHTPRAGASSPEAGAEVAYFLGGASAMRAEAYREVGGYFTELFYGHEEIELAWRLIDAGWRIRYLDDITVFHPATEISRHAHGWELTGRNRVWIARRTLPWPMALVHVLVWLVLGAIRTPAGPCRSSYLRGWWSGWKAPIEHRPIRWSTVWRLTKLGRPPIV